MFRIEEIDILIDAVEVWEKDGFSGAMLSSLLAVGLMSDKEKADEYTNKEIEKAREQGKQRKYTAITIKAKLIELRDKIEAGEFSDSVLKE